MSLEMDALFIDPDTSHPFLLLYIFVSFDLTRSAAPH